MSQSVTSSDLELVTNCDQFGVSASFETGSAELIANCDQFGTSSIGFFGFMTL